VTLRATIACTRVAVAELVVRVGVGLSGEQRVRGGDGQDGVVGEAAPGREEREVGVLDAVDFVDGADDVTSDRSDHD